MSNVRFTQIYYSSSNKKYEVKILDTELVASTNYEINFGDANGVVITRNGGTPLKPKRIISTSAKLNLQLLVQNDWDLYDDIKDSYEGRFFMEVNWFHPITGAFTNIFKGVILRDLSSREDAHEPRYSITAVDGLELLKNIDYYGDPVPNLKKRISEHVGRILEALPIAELYDTWQPMYQFAVDLRDENHAAGSIFARDTRVRNYFYEVKDGIKVFEKMYDVLHEFLSMINARIYFCEGVFHIDQLGYKGAGSTVDYEIFARDNTYDSTETSDGEVNFVSTNALSADANPMIKSVAPVQYVQVSQPGDNLQNILYGKEWSKDEASEELTTSITEVNDYDRIFFHFTLYHYMITTRPKLIPGTGAIPVAWIKMTVEIKVDDGVDTHYYKAEYKDVYYDVAHYYNKKVNINAVYSGTVADTIDIIIPISRLPEVTQDDEDPIYLTRVPVYITTDVLEHTGSVSVNITSFNLYTNSDVDTALTLDPIYATPGNSNEIYEWEATEPLFLIGRSLEEASKTSDRVTTLINDNRNNIVIEEEFSMVVLPGSSTYQKIEVWDGTEWVDSTGWKGTGDTTYQRIAVQVIRDIFKQRETPSDLIEISLWNQYDLSWYGYSRKFDYKGSKCIWLDWSHNTQTDTIKGTLWEMINATVADDPTVVITQVPTTIKGLPPGIITNPEPPEADSDGVTNFVDNDNLGDDFYDEGTMSGDNIDLTAYSNFPDTSVYTMKSINHSIKVHIGSTKYHIVDKIKANLSNTECRLEYSTSLIEFNRDLTGRLYTVDARKLYKIEPPTA